jgi:succinoglycan biosynthesis protein ExoO
MTAPNVSPSTVMVSEVPQVSVIIATYNCKPYLAAAIESALGQDSVDVEVVVVDDASTDGTAEVAQRYEGSGRVRLLVNEVNRGPSFSRNRAIQAARGEWVAQLDGDDWFAPGRLATLLQLAVVCQADLVADDLFMVEDSTLQAVSTPFLNNGVPWRAAQSVKPLDVIKYDLGSLKPLMRRAFLCEHSLAYEEGLNYGEDFLLLLKIMLAGARVIILPEPMYHLRRGNTGSLTTQRGRLLHQIENTTKQLMDDPDIRHHPSVVAALRARLSHVKRLAMLEEVVTLAKQGHVARVVRKLLVDPKLIRAALRRAPEVIAIRIRRRLYREVLNRSHRPPGAEMPGMP